MKFCDVCQNLLMVKFTDDIISFKCNSCQINYASGPEDTLRRDRIIENDINIFNKILDKAVDDPCALKARIKCKNTNCTEDIVKQVRVGKDMRLYNICTKCRIQWLN